MKRKTDEMRSEYSADLVKSGVRGKFAAAYRDEFKVVIDPDLRPLFPTAAAVNRALRDYISIKGKTR